jgi:hypothetical protein
MDERAHRLKRDGSQAIAKTEKATPETPADKEAKIERARARLDGLVTEIDRRRHELMDVRLQLRKHTLLVALVATGAAAIITTTALLVARSRRQRNSVWGRWKRVREALARMTEHPESVARNEPNLAKKIAASAGSAAASQIAKRLAERSVRAVTAAR